MSAPAAATPAKWTKKDLRTLRGFLHSFYVCSRPLDYRDNEVELPKIREALAKHRKDIVLSGIRAARATSAQRYREYCETVGNQLVRFHPAGEPDELRDRFIGLAREEDKAEKRLEALLHRVLEEPLPPEVEGYDPLASLP